MTETETAELETAEGGAAATAEAPDRLEDRPRAADLASAGRDNPPDLVEELAHLRVDVDADGEPILRREDGSVVDTWKEGYPYQQRMPRKEYDRQKRLLQIELLKLQEWVKDSGQKLVILFEGRDAAGKGGTIKRFTEHLNPRGARVVRWRSRTSGRAPSGTSSATWRTCPPPA